MTPSAVLALWAWNWPSVRMTSRRSGDGRIGTSRPARHGPAVGSGRLVPHTGFEPVISALRGRCPGPLDECGAAIAAGDERRTGRDDTSDRAVRANAAGPPGPRRLQPVRLEEGPDRLGDLEVARLADDQAVVRVGPERLVRRVEPVGQPLAVGLRDLPVEPGPDDELGDRRRPPADRPGRRPASAAGPPPPRSASGRAGAGSAGRRPGSGRAARAGASRAASPSR